MTYNEIVEKIKTHAPITVHETSAEQMIRLYLDKHMQYISYYGNQYELNLIQLEPGEHHIYELIKPDDDFIVFSDLLEIFIQNTKNNKRSFLICNHIEYEVVLELMESNE